MSNTYPNDSLESFLVRRASAWLIARNLMSEGYAVFADEVIARIDRNYPGGLGAWLTDMRPDIDRFHEACRVVAVRRFSHLRDDALIWQEAREGIGPYPLDDTVWKCCGVSRLDHCQC